MDYLKMINLFPYSLFDRFPNFEYQDFNIGLLKGKIYSDNVTDIYPIIDDYMKVESFGRVGIWSHIDYEIDTSNDQHIEICIKSLFDYVQVLIGYGPKTFFIFRGVYKLKRGNIKDQEDRMIISLYEYLNQIFVNQPIAKIIEEYPEGIKA